MKLIKGVRFLTILLFITSCNVSLVKNGVVYAGVSDENVLKQDGLYRGLSSKIYESDGKKIITQHQLNIINSNVIDYVSYSSYFDSTSLYLENYIYKGDPKHYVEPGDYIVRNDTIYANIPIALHGNNWLGWYIYKPYECSFQGYIKNQDTIIDWHLVPPYPNIKIKENFMGLVEPRMLYFIESEALLGLDSLYKSRKLID